jgi:nicotinamidase-related amidase
MMLRHDFNRAALLIVDAQQQFCDPLWGGGNQNTLAVCRRIRDIVPAFRTVGLPVMGVYFTNEGNTPRERIDYFKFHPAAEDAVLQKTTNSAFASGNTAAHIAAAGYRHLYMCGFNFSACLKATAMQAVNNGYDVTILRDLSANNDFARKPEDVATLEMQNAGIRIIDSASVLSL